MTNFILPILLGIVALAYIFTPLVMGASTRTIRHLDLVPGIEELDLDYALGKIDEEEWKQRRAQMEQAALEAQAARKPSINVERLIWQFRRSRRAEIAVEAEVLIARNRKKPNA